VTSKQLSPTASPVSAFTNAMYLLALVFFLRRFAWWVVLGMTVKVFIGEIICKSHLVWCVGRADFVKT
jgi:hypothetical protein